MTAPFDMKLSHHTLAKLYRLFLRASLVHTHPVGVRPEIELEPTEHPLAVEQREGITWERVDEIAAIMLHSSQS